jgi:hypothetical protein
MRSRTLWAIWIGLAAATLSAGCQSAGGEGVAAAPAFGLNHVPRQSEPPLESDDGATRHEPLDVEPDTSAANSKPGTLLSRLLPGRDKEAAPRKPLPVTARTSAASDDESEF